MPIVTTAAAIGAIWGCQILAAAATLPIVRSITPLSAALTAFGTQQPWTTLTTIALSLMTAWYSFGVIPILDWILGRELRNPTPEQAQVAADDGLYRGVLYAYVALHLTVLFVVGHFICTNPSISALAFLGAAISYGISNGVGFTVAHELLHGRSWMDKTAANLLLAPLCYMHWTKSHLMHHVKVATLEDPSSARKGESLWSFIPRSVIGNIKDGYGAEAARRRAKKIPFWDTRNRSLWWAGSPILLGTLATAVYGLKGLAFLFLQAGVGILMLEIVNYIEHYGLARKKVSNGRYERVEPRHSWNATTIYTNAVSFRLQRHSDHHAHENIPYQSLKDIREAPQLPAGYPVMMLLSTIPPLYFKIMNPRVDEAAAAAALGA
jgi:alkane 1-monooxygenase